MPTWQVEYYGTYRSHDDVISVKFVSCLSERYIERYDWVLDEISHELRQDRILLYNVEETDPGLDDVTDNRYQKRDPINQDFASRWKKILVTVVVWQD